MDMTNAVYWGFHFLPFVAFKSFFLLRTSFRTGAAYGVLSCFGLSLFYPVNSMPNNTHYP